ncbi:Virulence factor mviN homolog [Nitrospira defluvii]|jgi:putative peptidoglycan lipid II flippase|uniref:Virulence factor mviN homolog n=1 Tax=Nitrospira defluvii TaxID=330214 RepID=D8PGM9_9BACT|nr:Virulence factor mviN homolog [Nitrospira defluvii]
MNHSLRIGLKWWATWQRQASNRRVLAALFTVGGCSLLGKVSAFAKDAVVAYQFGRGDELDAFLIALVIPQFTITLLGGSLNAALIPTYIQVREQEGPEAAQRVFSTVTLLTSGFLVLTCLILMLSAPWLMPLLAGGYATEKLSLAKALYAVLLSTILFSGIGTTWGAVLNAGNRFALAAAVPLVTSLTTMLAVLWLARSWSVYALALAAVTGAFIEAALLGWQLKRLGISLLPRWYGVTPATREVLGQYWPMVAAAFLMGSTHLISQGMAAMLDPGSVSALGYGNKVTAVLLGIGATAVGTAFLPHFSRMVALNDWNGIRDTLFSYTGLLLAVTVPVTAFLMYMSEPVIALLFQRGAFTESDTKIVGEVQIMYLLQVPPCIAGMLAVRLIAAMKSTHIMLWGNTLNILMCVVLTYFLMRQFGVVGIALATSAMYMVSFCFLWIVSVRCLATKTAVRQRK